MINYVELVKNNPQYFKQFTCRNLLFLNYDCPVKEKKVAKWSEYHYIYYVLTGKKTLHTLDTAVELTSGSIAFIKKGACIVEQFFMDPFCIVVFIIPDSFIISFLNEYLPGLQPQGESHQLVIPIEPDARMHSFYQSIIPYFATEDEVPEAILELRFKELMLQMLHNPDNEELKNYFLHLRAQERSPISEIMEANYAYNLNIEAYARMTNRSVSSFKRDFQSIYKTTPGRWLIEKKLERARRLLLETDMPVSELAFESGFENTAHFNRIFKQKSGMTPLHYRKLGQEQAAIAI
jgi:AraC family transcriptional regulator, exoenzyme S synthesis regulatory protein ExsA